MTTTPPEPDEAGAEAIVSALATVAAGVKSRETGWQAYAAAREAANATVVKNLTAENGQLLARISELETPAPAPTPFKPDPTPAGVKRVLIGAAYYSNLNKSDGVAEAAGVPYDAVRIYAAAGASDATLASYVRKAASLAATDLVLSMKVPKAWSAMTDPAWFAARAKAVNDAAAAAKVTVWLMFHHEPENDTGANPGQTKAGRDAWAAMTKVAGSAIRGKFSHVLWGVCLMGYWSYKSGADLWKLENVMPLCGPVDFVLFDLYQEYGNANHPTSFTSPEVGIKVLAAYCNPKGIRWGLGEAGVLRPGFAAPRGKGSYFFDTDPTSTVGMIGMMRALGGSLFCYFNTDAKSVDAPDFAHKNAMEPGGPRYNAWVTVVRNKAKMTVTA